MRPGPFQIGVGVAGSEIGVGECGDLEWWWGYDVVKKMGGAYLGTSTLVDAVVKGIIGGATFSMHQIDSVNLLKVFPLATLSAGATSKSLTPTTALVVGKALQAIAARIRFHWMSEATLTDESQDVVCESGIIIPRGDPVSYDLDEERVIVQPCELLAFWDATTDTPFVFGKNVA